MNPSWLLTALLQGDDVTTYVNGQLDQYRKTGDVSIGQQISNLFAFVDDRNSPNLAQVS